METAELLQLSFDKIMQTRTYTVIVLKTLEKRFAIYTEPHVGKHLQMILTEVESVRPQTYELIDKILEGTEIRVKQVVIYDVQDTVYYALLFLEQDLNEVRHIVEIDVRPSDALILALTNNAPIYCTREVLDKTIPVEE